MLGQSNLSSEEKIRRAVRAAKLEMVPAHIEFQEGSARSQTGERFQSVRHGARRVVLSGNQTRAFSRRSHARCCAQAPE